MTEAELEDHIRRACAGLGILRFHIPDARGMSRGMPDDLLIGRHGILWRECKSFRGRLTSEQRKVGYALQALGQDWDWWTPADWLSGRIEQELEAIR